MTFGRDYRTMYVVFFFRPRNTRRAFSPQPPLVYTFCFQAHVYSPLERDAWPTAKRPTQATKKVLIIGLPTELLGHGTQKWWPTIGDVLFAYDPGVRRFEPRHHRNEKNVTLALSAAPNPVITGGKKKKRDAVSQWVVL